MNYNDEFNRIAKDKEIIAEMESLWLKLSYRTQKADAGRAVPNGLDSLMSKLDLEEEERKEEFNRKIHKVFEGDFQLVKRLLDGEITIDQFIEEKRGSDE